MTRFIIHLSLITFGLFFFACSKKTEDVSRVTFYPIFTIKERVAVLKGQTYTPDVVVKAGDAEVTPEVDDSKLETTKKGVYTVSFSAKNEDGVSVSGSQVVVVYEGKGTDISGKIHDVGRPERTGEITRVEESNVFYCTDCAFGSTFPVYIEMNGDEISIPDQQFVFSSVASVESSYDPVAKILSFTIRPQGFSYKFEYDK